MDSESQDQYPSCVVCQSPAFNIYFRQRGPFCIMHWLEAYKAADAPRLNYDHCKKCGRMGIVLMFEDLGPFCVPHYLEFSVDRGQRQRGEPDEEIDENE